MAGESVKMCQLIKGECFKTSKWGDSARSCNREGGGEGERGAGRVVKGVL